MIANMLYAQLAHSKAPGSPLQQPWNLSAMVQCVDGKFTNESMLALIMSMSMLA